MGVSLTLYNHPKRYNSTARPTSPGRTVDVTLKQGTSLNAPIFYLSGSQPTENYASFNGAYYFIEDITSVRADLWQIDCVIDVLATAKDEILASDAYVEYCTGGRTDIFDNRIAPTVNTTATSGLVDIGINTTGHYNLAVTGAAGVTIWQVTEGMLNSVLSNIQQWADNLIPVSGDIVATVGNGLRQMVSQGSAMDCIRSCRWLPFPNSSGTGGSIWAGNYNTGVAAVRVVDPLTVKSADINIPFSRSGMFRLPPYSEVLIYLPFVGMVNITHPRMVDVSSVHINVSIDNRSGDIAYDIIVGGAHVGCYGASTAVDIPIGISNVSPLKVAQSVGIAAGIAATAGAGAAALTAVGAAAALSPTPSAIGGVQGGAGAGLPTNISWCLIEHGASGAAGNMDAVEGTPMFKTVSLSTISGYVKTRGAAIVTALRGSDKDRLNNMLDSGIFIE